MNKFTFLSKVFKYLGEDEIPIVVDASKGWRAESPTFALDMRPPTPIYFSIAAHSIKKLRSKKNLAPGAVRRGKEYFSSAHVFVLDDVGTKCPVPPVTPSYIIETSIGNFQYGYLLHPFPYAYQFEATMRLLADSGWTDGGSVDPVHLFRLPGSLHKTGFKAVLTYSDFRRRRELVDWMRMFGLEVPDVRKQPHMRKGRPVTKEMVEGDAAYTWLQDHRLVTEPMNSSGWVSIVCPWSHNHTQGDDSDDAWSYARYKPGAGVFTCFHEGCAKRTNHDFTLWLNEEKFHVEKAQAKKSKARKVAARKNQPRANTA